MSKYNRRTGNTLILIFIVAVALMTVAFFWFSSFITYPKNTTQSSLLFSPEVEGLTSRAIFVGIIILVAVFLVILVVITVMFLRS